VRNGYTPAIHSKLCMGLLGDEHFSTGGGIVTGDFWDTRRGRLADPRGQP